MHRDFKRYILSGEDQLTYRKWLRGLGIFYELSALLFVSLIMVRTYQNSVPPNTARVAATATTLAIKNNRGH